MACACGGCVTGIIPLSPLWDAHTAQWAETKLPEDTPEAIG